MPKSGKRPIAMALNTFPITLPNNANTNTAIPNVILPRIPNIVNSTFETCPVGTVYLMGLKENLLLLFVWLGTLL